MAINLYDTQRLMFHEQTLLDNETIEEFWKRLKLLAADFKACHNGVEVGEEALRSATIFSLTGAGLHDTVKKLTDGLQKKPSTLASSLVDSAKIIVQQDEQWKIFTARAKLVSETQSQRTKASTAGKTESPGQGTVNQLLANVHGKERRKAIHKLKQKQKRQEKKGQDRDQPDQRGNTAGKDSRKDHAKDNASDSGKDGERSKRKRCDTHFRFCKEGYSDVCQLCDGPPKDFYKNRDKYRTLRDKAKKKNDKGRINTLITSDGECSDSPAIDDPPEDPLTDKEFVKYMGLNSHEELQHKWLEFQRTKSVASKPSAKAATPLHAAANMVIQSRKKANKDNEFESVPWQPEQPRIIRTIQHANASHVSVSHVDISRHITQSRRCHPS